MLMIVCATAVAVSVASAEPELSRYRGVTLGDPVQVVVDQLKVTPSDVKVVHERPDADSTDHMATASIGQWHHRRARSVG